jgi:hypothetical protein
VTLYDAALSFRLDALARILRRDDGRGDQALARVAALPLLQAMLPGVEPGVAPDADMSGIQDNRGGLRRFSYSAADPQLTALALAACPERVGVGPAVGYLYDVVYDRASASGQIAAAYAGLAAAGQPVLLDIRNLLATGALPEAEDSVWLAWGLALLGDAGTANAWLESHPAGADESATLTTARALLAATLGVADAQARAQSIGDDAPLALLYVLKTLPLPASEGAAVTYTLDGETRTEALTAAQPTLTLKLTATQLQSADFAEKSGDVRALARYIASGDGLDATAADRQHIGGITIDKTLAAAPSGTAGVYRVSMVVTVEDAYVNAGPVTLTDLLPVNLRYLRTISVGGEQGHWNLSQADGGRQVFVLYPVEGVSRYRVIYEARMALPGEYAVEPAVAKMPARGLVAATAATVMTFPAV